VTYHQLAWIEVRVLEAIFERRARGFVTLEVPGANPELVAVTVCRLMHKGLIEATPDGIQGKLTPAGETWMRSYGRTH
jgi:hypothetical protein